MFKLPFFSETPGTVKSRSGFHELPESAKATQSIYKSISRDNMLQSSTARNFNEREDFRDSASTGLAVRSFDLPDDPSFWKDHNVQVIIRLRPLNSSEISTHGNNRCVRQESCQTLTWTGHPESRFTFDVIADENVTQENLFKVAGVPMVENCIGGYNSCMFAYGQTGSGKTHTMLGDIEGGTRRHSVNCGMTPRVFEYLFSSIQKEKEARRDEKLRFNCKCSFLEIYNEQILDLLNPSSVNLQIREDLKKGVYVENLTELEVTSSREVMQQLLEGAANRKVAATNMNRASSRSHSVFTCVIESTWESQGVTHHRFARLNLVDLAGSERQKSSGAEGERLKEATNINKSLSTLGLVIMNLVSISNGKAQHVPYRDSKLTFLLQDSLGGNSKTTIIANISPSTCSALETLSTLKFAQRAKFIKNNATVNEDASGDVLAMRVQIQQLKKEVSQLRGLLNGGAGNHDNESMSSGLLGSPGTFKWEGLNCISSPLTTDKSRSQRKEYEIALVGAFRREKEKEMALEALAAETQAAVQLAKQREDEIQVLKMRLRFREAGIKRLEAVASGKISAETHLLKEKEEHLRELEVLRAQVDRNQEVTRFATENLRLKEEVRRLKSFCDEGEMERMNEQIITLQNKLLEALDWKLMNESAPPNSQKSPVLLTDGNGDSDQLNPKKVSPWQSAIKGENEFLRLQAIQNQAEIDSLRKKLNSCVEEKLAIERKIKKLETELEEIRSSRDAKEEAQNLQINMSNAANDINTVSLDDQLELKAMVEAISAASQREAEAHEMAITLAKENDELRAKIKVLIEDNKELIELYERAASESNNSKVAELDLQERNNDPQKTGFDALTEKGPDAKKAEDLEHQLTDLHDENERLMSLYEKAMQERDDFKKMLSSAVVNNNEGDTNSNSRHFIQEIDQPTVCSEAKVLEEKTEYCQSVTVEEKFAVMRNELEKSRERLSCSSQIVGEFAVLENAILDLDKLSRETEEMKGFLDSKQQEAESLEKRSSEMKGKKALLDNKLAAIKSSLWSISSSIDYFEQREIRARARVESSMSTLEQKKAILDSLEVQSEVLNVKKRELQEAEIKLRNNHLGLKSKLEEDNQKLENERVLFAIDNVEQKIWKAGSKATDLLKCEEEKTELQIEIKQSRENLVLMKNLLEELNKKTQKLSNEIHIASSEMKQASVRAMETEAALQNITNEKELLLEMRANGETEIRNLIAEYQMCIFDECTKEEELKIVEEEMRNTSMKLEEAQRERADSLKRSTELLLGNPMGFPSEKLQQGLEGIWNSILEANSLLFCEKPEHSTDKLSHFVCQPV